VTQLILLIEDEPEILRVLRHPLEAAGYAVELAESVETGLQAIARLKPTLVLLDLGLGARDGKDVIRGARQWSDVPIIVLSARFSESEKVAALDLGADDFINKPFGVGELLARMRTALRHRAIRQRGDASVTHGELRIDFLTRRARVSGRYIHLTPREYDVLRILVQHAGQVVTHRQILDGAWAQGDVSDYQNVRVVVAQLRRKLEEAKCAWPRIMTEQGIGYRLEAEEESARE
jgi:two-component system KDP operon response regulator KdpE